MHMPRTAAYSWQKLPRLVAAEVTPDQILFSEVLCPRCGDVAEPTNIGADPIEYTCISCYTTFDVPQGGGPVTITSRHKTADMVRTRTSIPTQLQEAGYDVQTVHEPDSQGGRLLFRINGGDPMTPGEAADRYLGGFSNAFGKNSALDTRFDSASAPSANTLHQVAGWLRECASALDRDNYSSARSKVDDARRVIEDLANGGDGDWFSR